MAGITLARALKAFASEVGCGDSDDTDELIDSIQEGIEWMLFNGGGDILREWTVTASDGLFVLPRDLEVPIKFKYNKDFNAGYGTFHSAYFSYGSQSVSSCCDYLDWERNIQVNVSKIPIQYRPPKCGIRLVATTKNPLDVGKKVMINGKQRGFDIVSTHNGFKTSGELLTVYLESDPQKKYSAFNFDEITSIVKDNMCDYMMLSGIDTKEQFYHLAHIHPDDTIPLYTEVQVYGCSCFNAQSTSEYQLYILGRVNPSIRYIRDEDILPITSFEMLKLLAKRARYDSSGDFNEVNAMEQRLRVLIKKQVAYQQKANRQMSVNLAASGFTLSNI